MKIPITVIARLLYLLATLGLIAGCASNKGEEPMAPQTITLSSDAFAHDGSIPARFTCDGDDVSPALSWEGAPENTKSFALIMDDPDAPGKTFVHWVYLDIPAGTTSLPEHIPNAERPSPGGIQGRNDFRKIGYGGPCPPGGEHRYFFKLYALDTTLALNPGATKSDVLKAAEGHVLAQGELIGKYTR